MFLRFTPADESFWHSLVLLRDSPDLHPFDGIFLLAFGQRPGRFWGRIDVRWVSRSHPQERTSG